MNNGVVDFNHRRRLLGLALAAPFVAGRPALAQGDAQLLWAGHRALIEDRYEEALRHYRAAERRGSLFAGLDTLIELVEARGGLGAIAPADAHRIVALYVTAIDTVGRDGQVASRPDVTDAQRADWRIYWGVLRRVIEAMSAGGWTLAVEERAATATVHEGAALKPANPDHLGLGRWFFEMCDSVDTFVTFSNTTSPSFGLARRYPFVEGVLYGPHRGMMEVGAHPSFMLLLHEFFHVIEWSAGKAIPVAHGFEPGRRSAYPAWSGKSELDYYRWHFANTLPPLGWRRFNHSARFVSAPQRSAAALERVAAVYARIPLADRQEARRLAEEAGRLGRGNPAALRLLERALALSPYAPEALGPLVAAYRNSGRAGEAEPLAQRLAETRAVAGFVELSS